MPIVVRVGVPDTRKGQAMSDYNPEADEISEDDLIAASDFYDRLVREAQEDNEDA